MPVKVEGGRTTAHAAVTAVGLAALLVLPFSERAAADPSAQAVTVISAVRADVARRIDVVGSLVPQEDVLVSAEVGGYALITLAAEEGDHVAAGQVLAGLSADTLDIQLAQNAATLARDDAAITQARSQIDQMRSGEAQAATALDRAQRLIKVGAGTQEVLDQRLSAANTAKAQIAFADGSLAAAQADKALVEAQRRELQLNRARTQIRSPVDGIILSRSAQIGAIVSIGGGPLFHIARGGTIELAAEVVESALPDVRAGQAASIHMEGGAEPLAGVVRLVSPEVDKTTRLGKLRIALPQGADLPAGIFARAEILLAKRNSIMVPPSAVLSASDRPAVKLVVDGKVRTQEVVTGVRTRGGVEIVGGLDSGQSVVVRAGPFLHDGQSVTPFRSASAGDAR